MCGFYTILGVNPAILCHGDLWLNNLLFAGDDLKGILDWQTVHLGEKL
jgi:aminoglycoside phosphotransferase (APT) family kinase protein